jgi:uncharacterized protein
MTTQQSAIELSKKFTDELISAGIPLKKTILFGSYAKKSQSEFSDFDICLISNSFIGVGFMDWKPFLKILIKDEYALIQAKTYASQDFENGDPFIDEIKSTGILIWEA